MLCFICGRERGKERRGEERRKGWREKWNHRDENELGRNGESKSNESYKLATGGVKVRTDSWVAQKCTGIAISLGFISSKEMGRE